jgi:hypothetical protein
VRADGGAYSVRRLFDDYTGPLMQVERTSDLAVQDIGYNFYGNLDEQALLSFVGSASGRVIKWYDQSTNSQTVTASSDAAPWIVADGTIIKKNNKPTLLFQMTQQLLVNADTNYMMYNVFAVESHSTLGETSGRILSKRGSDLLLVSSTSAFKFQPQANKQRSAFTYSASLFNYLNVILLNRLEK